MGETACFEPDVGDGDGRAANRQVLECGESNARHRFGGHGRTVAMELLGWRSRGQGLDFVAPGVLLSLSGWTNSWSFEWLDKFKSGATPRYTALQDAGAPAIPLVPMNPRRLRPASTLVRP